MAVQKLQSRPKEMPVTSSVTEAFDVVQDAEPAAARPLFGAPAIGKNSGAEDRSQAESTTYASSASLMPFAVVSQSADASAVRSLAGASSVDPALSGSGFTYRHDWGRRRGQVTLRLNIAGVTARTRVMVSIGEGAAGGADAGKFIGAARFTLHNVAPRVGGVDVWVNVEWGADIPLYIDYLFVNP